MSQYTCIKLCRTVQLSQANYASDTAVESTQNGYRISCPGG